MLQQPHPLLLVLLQPYPLFRMLLQPHPLFIMFLQHHPGLLSVATTSSCITLCCFNPIKSGISTYLNTNFCSKRFYTMMPLANYKKI